MKYLVSLLIASILFGCGYDSVDSELVGQVKKVRNLTPIICNNFSDVDISLGFMRNGIGSMSTQDLWLYVPSTEHIKMLKTAADSGTLVKVTYRVARFRWCVQEHEVTNVEYIK